MQPPVIAFLVNGDAGSAMGIRAQSLEQRLRGEFRIEIAYRSPNKVAAVWNFFRTLIRLRPELCYVFDMSFSGVLAAGLYRPIGRCRVVVETGDAIYELSRLTGNRGPVGLLLTRMLERFSIFISDRIVVRSHPHQELLAAEGIAADVIPDGVDTKQFFPHEDAGLRREHGLEGFTSVGLVGSLIWNDRWQICYGWELIEVIHRLRERAVKGLIIGDGSGLEKLKARAAALGIADRIVFVGRIPYNDLARYLNLMDICLSTQTNDAAGQVRTTGKLPLYLACGRFVLSTEVGEAARVLPAEMLVPYVGTMDVDYPERLAARVQTLLEHPERLSQGADGVAIARTCFEYDVLAAKLRSTLLQLLPEKSAPQQRQTAIPAEIEPRERRR